MYEPSNTPAPAVKRILFLFSDTGGGHRAAAEAIIAALRQRYGAAVQCEMVDVFRDYAPSPFKYAPEVYPVWVNRGRLMWTLSYHMSNRRGQPAAMTFMVRSIWRKFRRGLSRLFEDHPSDLIVSVHPLFNSLAMASLRRLPQRPPFITVVTDLVSTHAFWYNRHVERILVPTQPAVDRGLKLGINPDRLRVTGLPVHPDFANSLIGKAEAREKLAWDAQLPAILLVGGGAGMGPLFRIARRINALALPCQLVIVAGRNEKLKSKLDKVKWNQPTQIYGFVTNMPELMAASDILVTKAGPGTISEACMAGLPLIISDHIPGQEYGNVKYIIAHKAGVYARGPRRVARVINKWLHEPADRLKERGENAKKLAMPNAVWDIADELWQWCQKPPVDQPQKQRSETVTRRRFRRFGIRTPRRTTQGK
ncbi:MAG: glycosyltransferase [Anaerolineae bacterium]|nr:glycosyltransferase [Anaerolineae bacterium]